MTLEEKVTLAREAMKGRTGKRESVEELLAWIDGFVIPEISSEDLFWFPVDDVASYRNKDGKVVPYRLEADHISQHRLGWERVSHCIDDTAITWVRDNCASSVVRHLSQTLFFEDKAEAQRFIKEVQ